MCVPHSHSADFLESFVFLKIMKNEIFCLPKSGLNRLVPEGKIV